MSDNYREVVHQMEQAGLEFRPRDLPLKVDTTRKVTCGKGGKWWYRLHTFQPDGVSLSYIVGSFGSYRTGHAEKVHWDRDELTEAQRAQYRAERERQEAADRAARAEEERLAALSAAELWAGAAREGSSAYLARKGVAPEACRYMPDGSIVVPLLRYDLPREQALRACQRIYPGPRTHRRTGEDLPQKIFTKNFAKTGCSVRLGEISADTWLMLLCEGYATGLSIRMATGRRWPVFVALDAYNLSPVAELLRGLYPSAHMLICADDDWQSADHEGPNPGRRKARKAARAVDGCDVVYPVFSVPDRGPKETDFNDLHLREGLPVVARQLGRVIGMLEAVHGG